MKFLKKYPQIVAAILGVLAVICTFLPIISYEVKAENDAVHYYNLVTFLQTEFAFKWFIFIVLGFIVLGAILSLVSYKYEKVKGIVPLMYAISIALTFLFAQLVIQESGFRHAGYAVGLALVLVLCLLATIISMSDSKPWSTKDVAEDGVLIALAFVLNLIKLPIQTEGGSINFQMLPLFLIALRHGPYQGFICSGFVYGILTCLTDGYGIATFPFDYFVGFGSAAIVGLFSKLILNGSKTYNLKGELFLLLAIVLSTAVRLIGGCASSMVIYGADIVFALTYNYVYILVSGAVSGAVIMALYGPLLTVNRLYPVEK